MEGGAGTGQKCPGQGMQRGTLETAKDTGERAEHELAEPARAAPAW